MYRFDTSKDTQIRSGDASRTRRTPSRSGGVGFPYVVATGPRGLRPPASRHARVAVHRADHDHRRLRPGSLPLRAAKHHGEATERVCPVCRRETLVELNYTFGDELGQYSGRLKSRAELEPMAREHGEFSVYVVEVCQAAGGTTWWSRSSSVMGSPASATGGGAPPSSCACRLDPQVDASPQRERCCEVPPATPDYPRKGKGRIRRFLPSWRQWLALFTLGFAVLLIGFAWVYTRVDVPRPNEQALAQQSVFYYTNGKTVLARVGGTDRSSVALADLPVTTRQAVLAAEDRGFYQHGGFSPKGLARAVWNDAARRQPAGRLDDHPAAGQELLPDPAAHAVPQGQRGRAVDQDRAHDEQGPDPRGLPQHHLLRPRRVRHPGRVARVLRGAGAQPDPRAVRGAGRDHPQPRRLLARDQPGRAQGPLGVRPRRHGQGGLDHSRAAPGRGVPHDHRPPAGRKPRRHQGIPDRRDPQGARRPRVHRGAHRPGRSARRHDVQRQGPEGGDRRRRGGATRREGRPGRDSLPWTRRPAGCSRCTAGATT